MFYDGVPVFHRGDCCWKNVVHDDDYGNGDARLVGDVEDSPDGDVVGSLLLFSYSLADFFSLISLCRWIMNGMLLIELFILT